MLSQSANQMDSAAWCGGTINLKVQTPVILYFTEKQENNSTTLSAG